MSKIAVTAVVVVGLLIYNHYFCDGDGKPGQNRTSPSDPSRSRAQRPSTSPAAPTAPSSEKGESVKDPTTAELEGLRKLAEESHRKMLEARELAKRARERGDKDAEQRHFQGALMHQGTERIYKKKTAKLFFDEKNKGQPEGIVDLRGLDVEDAVDYANRELRSATQRQRPNNVVKFIVGKDLHEKDAKKKIRPAVEELCKKRQLSFSPDPANSRVLIVQC